MKFFLTRIEGLRTEDAVDCTDCKAHWGDVIAILGSINKIDLKFILNNSGKSYIILVSSGVRYMLTQTYFLKAFFINQLCSTNKWLKFVSRVKVLFFVFASLPLFYVSFVIAHKGPTVTTAFKPLLFSLQCSLLSALNATEWNSYKHNVLMPGLLVNFKVDN